VEKRGALSVESTTHLQSVALGCTAALKAQWYASVCSLLVARPLQYLGARRHDAVACNVQRRLALELASCFLLERSDVRQRRGGQEPMLTANGPHGGIRVQCSSGAL
jgi:hypothetical protein